ARLEFVTNKPIQRATLAAQLTRPAGRAGSDRNKGEVARDEPSGPSSNQRADEAKPAQRPELTPDVRSLACSQGSDDRHWSASLELTAAGIYQVKLVDTEGFDDP